MIKRILTAIGLLAVVFACVFWLRQYTLIATDLLILAFAVVGSYELYKSLKKGVYPKADTQVVDGEVVTTKSNIKPIASAIIVADVIMYPLTLFLGATGLVTTLCLSTIVAIGVFIFKKDSLELRDLGATVFNIVYPVIIMGLLIIMNHSKMGILSLFSVFAVVVMTDTMAYFVGVTCKGPKLCPHISPKKTISGAVGGIIGGILGMVITYFVVSYNGGLMSGMFPNEACTISIAALLPIGAICSVAAEIGDLGASIIKRKVGIKDFGNIFPGHGGVMDRIDSFLFVVPIMYIAFEVIYAIIGW